MSTVKANTYQDASGGSNAILYGAASPAGSMGFRNRIINGAMMIDQRNAGASVSLVSAQTYNLDRWFTSEDTDGTMTIQQSSTAPTGFSYSALITTTSADSSLGATQNAYFGQKIEGFNTADLMWGTANAQTVTLSFWVRSSLTGTFGGAITNSAFNRSYPFTYTISAANTWEQKAITITGDTTGTWVGATNGTGIQLLWGLGVGSTYSGTSGAWAGAGYISATGATSVVGTNGATWYITGVQLEVGSVATEFERRPYGLELSLCQRYYWECHPKSSPAYLRIATGANVTSNRCDPIIIYPVQMRATPSLTISSASDFGLYYNNNVYSCSTLSIDIASNISMNFIAALATTPLSGTGASQLFGNNSGVAQLGFSAEL